MFPLDITTECQQELTKYLRSISHEIASKIEDLTRYEIMDLEKTSGFLVRFLQ